MISNRRISAATLLAGLFLPMLACAASPSPPAAAHPEFYPSPDPVLKKLPFSEAVRAGDFLIVSGQIG